MEAKRILRPSDQLRGILVIEDNPADARLIEEAFKKNTQLRVLTVVETASQALAFLKRESPYTTALRPTLILLDWYIPGSGQAVLEQVRADPELRRIPVIVLTGATEPGDLEAMYTLQVNSCIRKSADVEKFFEAMDMLARYWCTVVRLPSH